MSISVVCPNGHHLTVPDRQAGKRFRCPLCLVQFDIPAAGSLPPGQSMANGAVSPAQAEESGAGEAKRLRRVITGLAFHYARLVVLLLDVLLVLLILIGNAFSEEKFQDTWWFQVLAWATYGLGMVGSMLGIAGSVLCFWAPAARARPFILVALMLDLVNFVVPMLLGLGWVFEAFFDTRAFFTLLVGRGLILFGAIPGLGLMSLEVAILLWSGPILFVAAWAFFLYYQRALARYFENEVAGGKVVELLARGFFLLVLPRAVWELVVWLLPIEAVALFLMFVVPWYFLVVFILLVLRQLTLIGILRERIRSRS